MGFKSWALCPLLLVSIRSVFSANILYATNVPSPSHHIWNRALAFGLAHKGHNVTYLAPDEDKVKPQNFTVVLLEDFYTALHDSANVNEMADFSTVEMMTAYREWSLVHCELALKTLGLKQLLDYPQDFKFDLVIFDLTFGVCFLPLIERFNYPPAVAVTAFLLPSYTSYMFGNHFYPAYIPWYSLPYTSEMSFMERVWNLLFTNYDMVLRATVQYPEETEMARKVFGEKTPPWSELETHLSLVLANTDPILDYPQSLPPNIIPVGGLHTRQPKQLPKDLQNLLDNAKNGVILFSLGTNIRSDKLKKEQQEALLSAFAQLSETVIWKFESQPPNLPKNVMVMQWLPQNDILGHPNVKLFIGHGGALSTQEAIYHGIPVIGIPFIVDQYVNSRMIVQKKLGLQIDAATMTSEIVLSTIKEVLNNPTYYENMKETSKKFKDRAETPLERGIFWLEYVIRHEGAKFLGTPGRNMPFYTSSGADVIAFLALLAIALILILLLIVRIVTKVIMPKKKIKVN